MASLKKGVGWYILTLGLFTLAIVFLPDIDRLIPASIAQILWFGFSITPVIKSADNKRLLGLIKPKWQTGVVVFLKIATVAFIILWFDTGGDIFLPQLSYYMFYSIVLAPVAEELFFRGYLQPIFEARITKWGGLILTALLFTAIHLPKIFIEGVVSPLFLMISFTLGIVYGFIRDKTGSVYNSMLSHAGWNVVVLFFVTT